MSVLRYDRKKDEEIRNYDPFGRGGGGAPMRDAQGNVLGRFCFNFIVDFEFLVVMSTGTILIV